MSLLQPARNQQAYLKAGIQGFAGSGKTFTAAQMAIGLSRDVGDGKPVAFFDTETGSDFVIPLFEDAGIELLSAKTRAFADLLTFMREAEAQCSVAIIDSISHVWKELLTAYKKRKRLSDKIPFHHWGPIKEEWGAFTDQYLNGKMHVILCGRAGYEYDLEDDGDGGRDLVKTGTKMKTEGELAYEPSLLLEMERIKKSALAKDPSVKGWIHRCTVLKDRTNTMNGEEIDNPVYATFAPILSRLNIGGEHLSLDTTRSSEDLFDSPDSLSKRKKQVEITLEEIKEALVLADIAGTGKDDKKKTAEELIKAFGTSAWSKIQDLRLESLTFGLSTLRLNLGLTQQGGDPIADEIADQESDLQFADEQTSLVDG
jgi:hypothetical protein